MRSGVGKIDLDTIFRLTFNGNIVRGVEPQTAGNQVLRYEINIEPSNHIVETMEKQMEAERDKRAEITLSDGERTAVVLVSEGDQIEAVNLSQGEKEKRINEAQGKAQEIELIAGATADGVRAIAQAIAQPGGDNALKVQLAEQFLVEYGNILQEANISVLPADLANLKSVIETVQTSVRSQETTWISTQSASILSLLGLYVLFVARSIRLVPNMEAFIVERLDRYRPSAPAFMF